MDLKIKEAFKWHDQLFSDLNRPDFCISEHYYNPEVDPKDFTKKRERPVVENKGKIIQALDKKNIDAAVNTNWLFLATLCILSQAAA